jgi:hypothetical protein
MDDQANPESGPDTTREIGSPRRPWSTPVVKRFSIERTMSGSGITDPANDDAIQ